MAKTEKSNRNILNHLDGNTIKTYLPKGARNRFGVSLKKLMSEGWSFRKKQNEPHYDYLQMILRLEYCDSTSCVDHNWCPICGLSKTSQKHQPDCELGNLCKLITKIAKGRK
jgi:hypothetical protein